MGYAEIWIIMSLILLSSFALANQNIDISDSAEVTVTRAKQASFPIIETLSASIISIFIFLIYLGIHRRKSNEL